MFGGLRLIAQQPRRYQGVEARGLGHPAGTPRARSQDPDSPRTIRSITGSGVRWIAALRLTPFVSDSGVPQRALRVVVAERPQSLFAASRVSRASPESSPATACSK